MSNMGIWNNTHQECARPTQTQMGMSDQTHGRCRHTNCKDPNARINAKPNINSNMSLLDSIGNNIEKAIQMCKPKSEVVELVDYNTSKQPRTMCNAKYQPKPQAASFFVLGGIPNLNLARLHTNGHV